jgi:hypothetical protein
MESFSEEENEFDRDILEDDDSSDPDEAVVEMGLSLRRVYLGMLKAGFEPAEAIRYIALVSHFAQDDV